MAWIYKLRVCLITTTAVILIVLAVIFTTLRALLPHATEYLTEVQQTLSNQVGLPVFVDSIDADMSWFTPRLKLVGVVIYDKESTKELFHFDEVIFSLAYVDSLINLSPMIGEIILVGADLYIEKHPQDRWLIQGVEIVGDGSNAPSSELMEVLQNTSFMLTDSDVHWKDFTNKTEAMDFIGVNLAIESFVDEHSLSVEMQLPEGYGDTFRFIAKINDDLARYKTAEWEVYLEGRTINLTNFLNKLDMKEIPGVSGTLDGKLWLKIKNRELLRVTGDIAANTISLTKKQSTKRQWDADYVATSFDWQKMNDDWRVDIKDLTIVKHQDEWAEAADMIVVNSAGRGLSAAISYMRPFDLSGLPGIFINGDDLSKVEKFQAMFLGGDLYNFETYIPYDDLSGSVVNAVFIDVGMHHADSGITIYGADGALKYSHGRLDLNLLSESVSADFGDLFRRSISADLLIGEIVVSNDAASWIVESPDLYLINEDNEAHTRLKIVTGTEGNLFFDVQTNFMNAKGSSVNKYYPLTVMSETLVDWLDKGITNGVVKKGGFILFGDSNKFPYADNDGVMEVVFRASDLTLHFLDDWPDIEQLAGDVRFYNSSLSIENGTGKTYAGVIKNATAMIPDLNLPRLSVQGDITAPADDLQRYIWNSGLNDMLGTAMNQFQASGEIDLRLSLDIPLDDSGDEIKVKGELEFDGNELYFPSMKYSLNRLSGKLSFTEADMWGSNIAASFDKSPLKINVHSSDDNINPEIIFDLTGNLPVDGLLKRFDWIPDYWLSGMSTWDIAVHVPDKAEQYSVRVKMNSSLEGVELKFSDAVSKARPEQLNVGLVVDVLDEGLQVDVSADKAVTLFATRDDEAMWDFIVDSKYLRGSGEFKEDLDTSSTIKLNLEHVVLHELFYVEEPPSKDVPLNPTIIPSLNISAKYLTWDDWAFTNVSLETSWHSHGMLINNLSLLGPSLDVSGRGSWLRSWNNLDETNFKLFVNSSDLGNTLSTLQLGDSISRCEQVATVDLNWPAQPYRFSLSSAKGSAHVELSNGQVTDLKPGAGGRLLGLFNVFKLGDRFSLNFDDVYKEGFSFDSVIGDFKFDGGNAYTKNIEVKAAAADMSISGRVGIVERDYDLKMFVKPHSSAAAFTGGTIAGGPVVGTALVVLNKLLGLEKISRDEYSVTGSWDNPDVVQTSKRKDNNADVEQE